MRRHVVSWCDITIPELQAYPDHTYKPRPKIDSTWLAHDAATQMKRKIHETYSVLHVLFACVLTLGRVCVCVCVCVCVFLVFVCSIPRTHTILLRI